MKTSFREKIGLAVPQTEDDKIFCLKSDKAHKETKENILSNVRTGRLTKKEFESSYELTGSGTMADVLEVLNAFPKESKSEPKSESKSDSKSKSKSKSGSKSDSKSKSEPKAKKPKDSKDSKDSKLAEPTKDESIEALKDLIESFLDATDPELAKDPQPEPKLADYFVDEESSPQPEPNPADFVDEEGKVLRAKLFYKDDVIEEKDAITLYKYGALDLALIGYHQYMIKNGKIVKGKRLDGVLGDWDPPKAD